MRLALLLFASTCGCLQTDFTTCGSITCPRGFSCLAPSQADADKGAHEVCVSPDQVSACSAMPDGTACAFDNDLERGYCYNGACKRPTCGDYILDPTEACDDGNGVPFDGCNADCSSRFAKMQTPTGGPLCAVWAGGGEAYAVGAGATVLELDGARWTQIPTDGVIGSTADLYAVWKTEAALFVGGSTGLFQRIGGHWSPINSLGWRVEALWANSTGTDVYVGGFVDAPDYMLTKLGGSALPPLSPGCFPATITPNDVAAIWGIGGTVYVALADLDVICALDAAVGAWRPIATSSKKNGRFTGDADAIYNLQRGSFVSPGSLVLPNCGAYGIPSANALLQLPDTRIVVPGSLSDIARASPTELVGAGLSGVVLSLDRTNNTWTRLATPTEVSLFAVSASETDGVFIVGEAGTVLH